MGVSAPVPGLYTFIWPLFSNIFFFEKAKYQVSVYRTSGPLVSLSEPQAHRMSIQYRHDLGPSVIYWLASIQCHLHIRIKTCFSQKPFGQILQNFVCKVYVQGNENLLIWCWPHDRDGRHSPEPVDRLHLTFVYSSWDSSQSWIVLVLNHISLASF